MSEKTDLEKTEELFDFLQGKFPKGFVIPRKCRPKLTPKQAWTVIWHLGNLYWKVTDHIERCDVCGDLFDTHKEGECLDFGKPPYSICESCGSTCDVEKKRQSKANPDNKKRTTG